MPGTVLLIRHGQSLANLAAHGLGDSAYYDSEFLDAQLSDFGKTQAQGLQKSLGKDFHIDFVLTSTLHRALATASLGLAAHIDMGRGQAKQRDKQTSWIALDSLNESDAEFPPREPPWAGVSKPCNHRRRLSEGEKLHEFKHFDFSKYCSDEDLLVSECHDELEDRVKRFARELQEIIGSSEEAHTDKRARVMKPATEKAEASKTVAVVAHYVFFRKLLSMLGEARCELPNCGIKKIQLQQVFDLAGGCSI